MEIQFDSVAEAARELTENRFAIFPCYGTTTRVEGKMKAAMMPKNSPYYKTGVPLDVFMSEFYKVGVWIGIRCGEVSENLECLDFDNKFGDAKELFEKFTSIPDVKQIIETYGLYVEHTVSGGVHLCYKTHNKLTKVDDGGKIAKRLNKETGEVIALIETRTEGQYFVCAPSEGYVSIQGNLLTMQPIELDERNFLIEMAKSMDEYLDPKKMVAPQASRGRIQRSGDPDDLRPGDDYNSREESIQEMAKMLTDEGWRHVYGHYWRRPGKTTGISASLGYIAPNVFWCFTTSVGNIEPQKYYTPFSLLATLHFNGNFSECAKFLAKERGFGKDYKGKPDVEVDPTSPDPKKLITAAKDVLKRLEKFSDLKDKDIQILARTTGVSPEEAEEVLTKLNERVPELVGFDFLQPLEKSRKWILRNYNITRNAITKELSISPVSNPDKRLNENDLYLSLNINKIKTKKEDLNSILNSSSIKEVNPILDYFKSLPAWKESDQDYIQMYASYFGCKNEEHQTFFENMFKKHLVRSIYCSINGIENRYCMVLLGEQDDGKSTFVRKLCFNENYYTQKDITDGNIRDVKMAMFENFIWQLEEIDSYSKSQVNKMKAMISMGYDKDRDFYGKKAEYRVRIVNFWATGNQDEILTDETGNTRFLVFRGKIKSHDYNNHLTGVVKVPLELLWAQAFYLYQKGRDAYDPELTKDEKKLRDEINVSYEVSNDIEGHLLDLFEPSPINSMWSSAKISRYLNRKKIFAQTKQINYAIEKLIKKGIWTQVKTEGAGGLRKYGVSLRRETDSDFQMMQTNGEDQFKNDEGDLPF